MGISMNAEIIQRAWRKVDIKLAMDGQMHVLRWRRGWFVDELLIDDRRIATATGLFDRETIYGVEVKGENGDATRLLLTIDPAESMTDFSGESKPRGVRLETAETTLIAYGSLGPDRAEPFRQLFDRAVQSLGLTS